MKRIIKFSGIAAVVFVIALSMAGCGNNHVHRWEWHRTETEHWQECTAKDCDEEQNRGTHEDSVCTVCAEFKVLALGFADCIGKEGVDDAHADFALEANVWFSQKGKELGFIYDSVDTYKKGWSNLNDENLANYDLVMFLNDRPSGRTEQIAFENFIKNGGAWMGFHVCAGCWATNKDDAAQYWKWFQDDFVGCGNHSHNTWNPTSEPMRVENYNHYATENLVLEDDTFVAAPCEWYAWEYDVSQNDDITVLLTLNPTVDNPAGDSPGEIWTSGTYPIAWANNNYKMVYMNWGHNLRPYNNGAEGKQSSTFSSEKQNQFMIDAMFGLTK